MGKIIGEFVSFGCENLETRTVAELYHKPVFESSLENVDTVIFDLGSVLIDGDFKDTLKNDPRIPNEYIDELISCWVDDSDFAETCTSNEYIMSVYKRTPKPLHQLIPVLAELSVTYLNVLPHTYSLLNELRKSGYSLYYLSNWSKWSAEELMRNGKFDFLKLFDGGLFSYEAVCKKPSNGIYEKFLSKYEIIPQNAVFFDDKKENIEAANRFGIHGIQFNKNTGDEILMDFLLGDSSFITEAKAIDHCEYTECPSCGGDIGVYLRGEPVYLCKKCGKYLGTVPFPKKEAAMSVKERNNLPDSIFGIPKLRKYPLHDKKHTEQAIKMFNHVDPKFETELADNILDAMEKFHISTDTIGEKNRLKKYVDEFAIVSEGLIWNDNTPEKIKKLKESITDSIANDFNIKDIIIRMQDSTKNRDFDSEEKKVTQIACSKNHVSIYGYSVKKSNYGTVEVCNTHTVIGSYEDYVLSIKFIGKIGKVSLSGIRILYDKNKCSIPKSVVFDLMDRFKPNVTNVKCTRRSIIIVALSEEIEKEFPRVDHKYGNKYGVKKIPGVGIRISVSRSVKEDSLIAASMPRQDYQPDAVYVINYMKNNTFNDIAICRDKMTNIFVCDGKESKPISLADFEECASQIHVYRYLGECDFLEIAKSKISNGLDFYKKITGDDTVTIESLNSDYRFEKSECFINELNSIKECIISSSPSKRNKDLYIPIIPLDNFNEAGSSVMYYRDLDGVFAQNVDTLQRSSSYKTVADIPLSTIELLKINK